MKLQYSLFMAIVAIVFGLIQQFAPDFPLSPELKLVLIVAFGYLLSKFGVEVVEKPADALRAVPGKVRSLFSKK